MHAFQPKPAQHPDGFLFCNAMQPQPLTPPCIDAQHYKLETNMEKQRALSNMRVVIELVTVLLPPLLGVVEEARGLSLP
jgi:hypothetical protein